MNHSFENSGPLGACPCGSGQRYDDCCGPLHQGIEQAATAEQLMRSRFSAYVLGLESYLMRTWDEATRPERIDFSSQDVKWTRLEIISRKKGDATDRKGMVEFKAYFVSQGQERVLHEISRFHKMDNRWLYRDGTFKSARERCPIKQPRR